MPTELAGGDGMIERPDHHFAPKENWINDPNGLILHKGTYHLFFQYNPYGNLWGNISWGHAISSDLLSWEELPVAISAQEEYAIFSGSVIHDSLNESGFGTMGSTPLVAIFTAHRESNQSQHLAFSLDEGETWQIYAGNPVLDVGESDFRDPKVFRLHDRWIMTIALPMKSQISFYSSTDLKRWHHLSDFGPAGAEGLWECPDLVQLGERWVLLVSLNPGGIAGGSGTQYFVGNFDGKVFTPDDNVIRWLDYGPDFYAAVTFNGTVDERIAIGWMNNWDYAAQLPARPWRGSMTIPRRLTLESGLIFSTPIYASLRLTLIPHASIFGLNFHYQDQASVSLRFDVEGREVEVDRGKAWTGPGSVVHRAPWERMDEVYLEIVADAGSLEIFTGSVVFTQLLDTSGKPTIEGVSCEVQLTGPSVND